MALSSAKKSEKSVSDEFTSDTKFPNLSASAVSWSAILAGAAVAAALSLILLVLGAGLGLSTVSPWAQKGLSAGAFGISTIIWLTVTQILAAGMGGYLAGRLRTKWAGVYVDEVYFRDTAHGFLTWAVATLATAALLTSVIGGIVNSGAQAAANLAGGATTSVAVAGAATSDGNKADDSVNTTTNSLEYYVDSLFRKNSSEATVRAEQGNAAAGDSSTRSISTLEVTRIFINSLDAQTLPAEDVTHIGQMISANTGLTQQEAESRVNDVYANLQQKIADAEAAAKDAAEKARKATIYATLWLFISLLMGAFSASLAATWGGRCRDA